MIWEGTEAAPPKFVSTPLRRTARHVIATAILFDSVVAVGTFLGVFVEPLHRFSEWRTLVIAVIVVATLAAVPAIAPRTLHAAVSNIVLCNNTHGAALAVQYRLGRQGDAMIASILPVFDA